MVFKAELVQKINELFNNKLNTTHMRKQDLQLILEKTTGKMVVDDRPVMNIPTLTREGGNRKDLPKSFTGGIR